MFLLYLTFDFCFFVSSQGKVGEGEGYIWLDKSEVAGVSEFGMEESLSVRTSGGRETELFGTHPR